MTHYNLQEFKNWLNEDESRKRGVNWEGAFSFVEKTLPRIKSEYQRCEKGDFSSFIICFLDGEDCWKYGGEDREIAQIIIWKWIEDKEKKERVEAKKLNYQLSWKTRVKQLAIGGLIALGGQKTYHYYQGESNSISPLVNYNNHTWLDNVYLNIPFNEKEYNELTNLLKIPPAGLGVLGTKKFRRINSVLFPNLSKNFPDLETEISDLVIQIPNKKTKLEKLITKTRNKLNKAEKYLLEQLLAENLNSEKLTELKEILSEHKAEIELILTKRQELRNLKKHLEKLQATQLETKIETNKYDKY